MTDSFATRWTPRVLSVLRIVFAFLFIAHGTQKLFGFPGSGQPMVHNLMTMFGAAGVLETFGGTLLFFGLFTRPVAFVLSGEMAVAYFTQHAIAGFWPILNRGELAAHYCFAWLFIAVAGGGPWSLDAWRARRRSPAG